MSEIPEEESIERGAVSAIGIALVALGIVVLGLVLWARTQADFVLSCHTFVGMQAQKADNVLFMKCTAAEFPMVMRPYMIIAGVFLLLSGGLRLAMVASPQFRRWVKKFSDD